MFTMAYFIKLFDVLFNNGMIFCCQSHPPKPNICGQGHDIGTPLGWAADLLATCTNVEWVEMSNNDKLTSLPQAIESL
jgi:hypothetical protein